MGKYIQSLFLLLTLAMVMCHGGSSTDEKPVRVDFSQQSGVLDQQIDHENERPLNIAISAMISPKETYIYYQDLLNYLSEKLHRPVQFKQRKTYQEVNDMLASGDIDIGFVCSGAYVEALRQFQLEIVAVPVVNGQPYYQAYIIVHQASRIETFSQLKGKSFAFTDPLSNTGYFYALQRLAKYRVTKEQFFSKIIFTYAHDYSIQAVAHRIVDGATIDGLIYNYLEKYQPEKVEKVKVIEKSENYGMPPVVASPRLARPVVRRIRDILLSMNHDSSGTKILDRLLIDRFTTADSTDYSMIRIPY